VKKIVDGMDSVFNFYNLTGFTGLFFHGFIWEP